MHKSRLRASGAGRLAPESGAVAKSTKILPDGTHEIQCPITGGLALGVHLDNDIIIYNTCVVSLWPDQVSNVEDDRELNEAIQAMDWRTYKDFVESLK